MLQLVAAEIDSPDIPCQDASQAATLLREVLGEHFAADVAPSPDDRLYSPMDMPAIVRLRAVICFLELPQK